MSETRESQQIKKDEYVKYLMSVKKTFSVTRASFIDGFSQIEIPVAIAYRPNSKVLSQSGGKGITREQALISALMESYECDSAEKVKPDVKRKSEEDLIQERILFISPKNLPTTLTTYNSKIKLDWCKGYILDEKNRKEEVLVPFGAVSVDFTKMASLMENTYMQYSTNGLASGIDKDDAIKSAIFEIIERHCVTSHEIKHAETTRYIDLLTLPCNIHTELIDKIICHDVDIEIYDLTLFEDFPVYSCYLYDEDGRANCGWGCHLDPEIAIIRAITEANQARSIQISGSREDMHKYDYFSNRRREKDERETLNKISKNKAFRRTGKKETSIYQLLKLLKKYNIEDPTVVILDTKDKMCTVRVVITNLHGYNYPGYKSMLSKNLLEDINSYEEQITHKPAGI